MTKMKESGIEWIGEIPKDWETIKIKYTSWLKGRIGWQGLTASEYIDEGPFLVTGTDFNNGVVNWSSCAHISKKRFDEDSDIHVKEGDLLITKDGTVGKVAIAKNCPAEVSLNSGVLLIRNVGKYKYYDRYLYYVLLSDEFWRWYTLSQTGQSTIKHLYQAQFYSFEFTYPSYKEQEKIAIFLDSECARIDAVIEQTSASIEEYKKLKQAVITQAVTKGIRPNRPMKDSGIEWIGKIPEDWNVVKITRVLDYRHPYPIGDGDHGLIKTDSYTSSGIPYIRVQNLGWGTDLLLDNLVFISEENNSRIANSTLHPNDVLFAKTGATIGKTGIIPESLPVANTTSHIGKITVSPNYNAKFVFYVLSSYVGFRQFWEIAGLKATRPELTIDEIKSIRLIIPTSKEEQDNIVQYLDYKCKELDKLILKKSSILSELETYKKSLIFEYVTGKKEVPV